MLVIQSIFSLVPLGRCLLLLTTVNRYPSKDSSGKFFFTTTSRTSRNVSIVRYRMSLVTILPLDFVMIHWIQRKSFRENSIEMIAAFLVQCYHICYLPGERYDITGAWPTCPDILRLNSDNNALRGFRTSTTAFCSVKTILPEFYNGHLWKILKDDFCKSQIRSESINTLCVFWN